MTPRHARPGPGPLTVPESTNGNLVTFTWSPADPCFVTMAVRYPDATTFVWEFARSILVAAFDFGGSDEAAFVMAAAYAGDVLAVTVESEIAVGQVRVSSARVRSWLDQTLRVVGVGEESAWRYAWAERLDPAMAGVK